MSQTRIVVIGGVAGGASAAARARRLDEHASVIVLERGADASFANCGLPYYVGGEIDDRQQLLVAGDRQLRDWLNLDVRTQSEVTRIDRDKGEVEVVDLAAGRTYRESYDYLVISTGAAPLRPPALLEQVGQDHSRVLSLRNMADVDRIKAVVDEGVTSAVVIGGGFIGLEMVEQLRHRKVTTHLVELLDQVMPPFDAEMVQPLHAALREHGVQLHLNDGVDSLSPNGDQVTVTLASGTTLTTDLVLMAIGVRPETQLARDAGLAVSERGTIVVDSHQRTSDPKIFAVGDAVQVSDPVLGGPTFVPLGGPANRQGRLAADRIFATDDQSSAQYRGSQGTSIVRLFQFAAGMTGATEKSLARHQKQRGVDYQVVFAHPNSHAGYYPGATPIALKLIYEIPSGRVLGAQAVGQQGVDKRIDVVAMAIQMRATVLDLEQAELCYAPPFGSAKDPVNMVGFIASNALRGQTHPLHVKDLAKIENRVVLDVRTEGEHAAGAVPAAVNVPLEQLRARIAEIPSGAPIVTYCKSGQRAYIAERILKQRGFESVHNLSGGYMTWMLFHPATETSNP